MIIKARSITKMKPRFNKDTYIPRTGHYLFILHAIFLIALFVVLTGFPSDSFARDRIVLNTSAEPPLTNAEETGILDLVYREAFSRIGYEVTISRIPAERAMTNVNKGIDDGKYIKIAGLSRLYPNTIQVSEKCIDYEFVIFTKKADFKPTDYDSLKPYNVAFINGWKILEKNVVGTASLTKVENAELLFKLLEKDRTDIIIYSRLEGYALVKDMGLKEIKVLEPPLIVRAMFLYMHKKHEVLVPKVAEALRDMKKDGTYTRLYNQALAPYINPEKQ